MNLKLVIIFSIIITIIIIIIHISQVYETLQEPEIISINLDYNPGGNRVNFDSEIFDVYSYLEDWDQERTVFNVLWIEKKNNYNYSEIESKNQNTVFVIPIFTHTAYWKDGFYEFFNNECDESCLTKPLDNDIHFIYESSRNAIQVLLLLGYDYITDVEVSNNPDILKRYDKVIILHNEYVTKKEFKAITSHPKVIYLYPNSMYAEIQYDDESHTISLVRGHGYPEKNIDNGFNWEFDNTRPYEFDNVCENWEFKEIKNGIMLNCYPENKIYQDVSLLKAIKDY